MAKRKEAAPKETPDIPAVETASEAVPQAAKETTSSSGGTRRRSRSPESSSPPPPPEPQDDPLSVGMPDDTDEHTPVEKTEPDDPEPKPASVKPTHSPRALQLAQYYGIDASEYTREDLESEIRLAREHQMAVDQAEERKKKAQPAAAEDWDLGEIEVEDEDTGETVKRKATADDLPKNPALLARELAKLRKDRAEDRKLVEHVLSREKQRADEAASDAVDAGFVAAGDQYAAIVGDGTWRDLDNDSAEAKARIAIARAAGIDWNNDTPATIKKKVSETTKTLYGGLVGPSKASVPAPKSKIEQNKDKWKGAGVAQPTASRKEKPSAFDQLMEATGGKVSRGDDQDEDTLDIFDE